MYNIEKRPRRGIPNYKVYIYTCTANQRSIKKHATKVCWSIYYIPKNNLWAKEIYLMIKNKTRKPGYARPKFQSPIFISISINFNSFPWILYISSNFNTFPEVFSDFNNCGRSPKIIKDCQRSQQIAEDCWRLPKIAEDH